MITNFAPIYPIPLPKTVQRLLEFGQLRFMFERKRDLQFWQLVCAKDKFHPLASGTVAQQTRIVAFVN